MLVMEQFRVTVWPAGNTGGIGHWTATRQSSGRRASPAPRIRAGALPSASKSQCWFRSATRRGLVRKPLRAPSTRAAGTNSRSYTSRQGNGMRSRTSQVLRDSTAMLARSVPPVAQRFALSPTYSRSPLTANPLGHDSKRTRWRTVPLEASMRNNSFRAELHTAQAPSTRRGL